MGSTATAICRSLNLSSFSPKPKHSSPQTLPFRQPNPLSLRPNSNSIPNHSHSLSLSLFSNNVCLFASDNSSLSRLSAHGLSATPLSYEFTDSSSELELRLHLGTREIESPKDVFVEANDTNLTVKLQNSGSLVTLIETNRLFDRVKASETIWYIDDDELVVNLKKQDPDLKWPDIMESWESLTTGASQLLKGASVYIVGDSTEINQKVAQELAVGVGYTPLSTKELLESFTKQNIDSWVLTDGYEAVAESESGVLESLSSHVRTVVATLGGKQGASRNSDKWRYLYAGFTVWLSQTEAIDEDSAKEEAWQHVQDGSLAYSKSDVVVKFQGWDPDHAKSLAQACLRALKQFILTDKKLPDKKSLYIRLGCRGDWPNIKPPGWDPSGKNDMSSSA